MAREERAREFLGDMAKRGREDSATARRAASSLASELLHEHDAARVERMLLDVARRDDAVEVFEKTARILGPKKKRVLLCDIYAIYLKHRGSENLERLSPILRKAERLVESQAR